MRILLDLDEVLCDFVGGCCRAFNADHGIVRSFWVPGEWNMVPPLGMAKGFNITESFFWALIGEKGERFWSELEPLPWAKQVVALVESLTDDWHIISAPSKCPTSYSGKVKWLKNYFGKDFDRFALTPHKAIFAGEDTLLIDDKEQNVIDFIAAGGNGILFPRHHNSLHLLKDDPVGHLRRMLLPKGAPRAYQDAERELSLSDVGGRHPHGFDPDQAV